MYYVTDILIHSLATRPRSVYGSFALLFSYFRAAIRPARANEPHDDIVSTPSSVGARSPIAGEIASKIITNSCQCSILPPPRARCKINGLDKTNTWLDLICTLYFPPNFQQHRQLQHRIAIFLLLYFVLLHQLFRI